MTDFERLGVPEGASREELERAFLRKKAELHPDIVNGRRRREGLPPDPKADETFRELVAAFARLTAAGNGGEVPGWAKDLIGRWDLVVGAAKRGDIPGALGELTNLATAVQDKGNHVISEANRVHQSVVDGIENAKALGRGLSSLWDHLTRTPK